MKFWLHENSLTIPSEELPGFLGSPTIAKEFRAEVKPTVNRHKCVLYERSQVIAWFDRKFGGKIQPAREGK